jgi:hypothetical protein
VALVIINQTTQYKEEEEGSYPGPWSAASGPEAPSRAGMAVAVAAAVAEAESWWVCG